jgi:hypothetical protein
VENSGNNGWTVIVIFIMYIGLWTMQGLIGRQKEKGINLYARVIVEEFVALHFSLMQWWGMYLNNDTPSIIGQWFVSNSWDGGIRLW